MGNRRESPSPFWGGARDWGWFPPQEHDLGRIILGIILGYVAGHASSVLGYILMTTYGGVFDRDGGGAMGAIFILGPMLGVVGAIAGVIIAALTRKPKGS